MKDDPNDILIVTLGAGYYVGPRDQRRRGMRFGTHSEAVRWAYATAGGHRVIDKTGVTRPGYGSRAQSRRTRVVLIDTPCGVIGLPGGRSVSTSRGRELARRELARRTRGRR